MSQYIFVSIEIWMKYVTEDQDHDSSGAELGVQLGTGMKTTQI